MVGVRCAKVQMKRWPLSMCSPLRQIGLTVQSTQRAIAQKYACPLLDFVISDQSDSRTEFYWPPRRDLCQQEICGETCVCEPDCEKGGKKETKRVSVRRMQITTRGYGSGGQCGEGERHAFCFLGSDLDF